MKHLSILFYLFLLTQCVLGQDNYHLTIEQMLANEYGLQNGEWVCFDNEQQNLGITYNYGSVDLIQLTTQTEDFTRVTNILNEVEGDYPYDSGWGIENQNTVLEDDVCLLVINLRKTNNPNINDLGKVTVGIQAEDNSIFEELITIQLENQWNQYLIPFQASTTYQPTELVAILNLAWEVQEIEIAGTNIINFGNNYNLEDLPLVLHNERYGGYEANAPWRAEAANRIEMHRKADLNITVNDDNGNPIPNAQVSVTMLEPAFGWGTAIELDRIANNINHTQEYEDILLDLDGQGHKFNWIVPGSSFKWPGIEENWVAPFEQKVNAVNWLKDNGYDIRFHTLVWPGWINTPFDIEANADDPQYIIDRTTNWIDFILNHPDLQNIFDEYDVLNEVTTNRDFEMTFAGYGPYTTGREFYIEVMNQASNLVPDKPKVINDYVTLSSQQNKGFQYDFLKNIIQELIDGGTDLNGIGFQSHLQLFPNSIYEVEETLADFAQFDLALKITEYDIIDPRIDPDLAAKYLEDFITMIYSIPEVDMFMFWGVWDGTHWVQNGTLFNEDWTPKPAATAFFNKVFNEWWTEEVTNANANGLATFRPFKGEYEIVIEYGNTTIIDTVSVLGDLALTYSNAECPESIIADAPLDPANVSGLQQASESIEWSGSVVRGSNTTFQAGNCVKINEEFEVPPNTQFTIDIQPCGTPPLPKPNENEVKKD